MSLSLSVRHEPDISFAPLILASIVFHIVVLIGLPLLSQIIWRPQKFERPHTFRLVTAPKPKQLTAPQTPTVEKKKVEKKKKVPASKSDTPVRTKEPEEDLSELEDLLGGIQAPAVNMDFGADIVDWYKASILSKIERNWRPPLRDPNMSVKVVFIIFLNGGISEVKLAKSSGNGSVDNTAMRAVKLSAPFGKLPPNYSGSSLEVNLTLIPTLR